MNKLDSILKKVEKPGRYIGKEFNIAVKDPSRVLLRFAFAFPDVYEIGMSYTGLQIIYNILNNQEDVYCERVFAPAIDMEEQMRCENLPLFTLETKTPVKDMDFIGFTLQYEMSYTNILNMLNLANIPVFVKERDEKRKEGIDFPIIVAGGPCAYNPEPLADFIDVFLVGDGEEQLVDFSKLYIECKKNNLSKNEFLIKASKLDGVYVPKFYDVQYGEKNHVIKDIVKIEKNAEDLPIKRAILDNFKEVDFPVKPIVPIVETVHDRSIIEIFRGCTRGCRFCQAGMIYRPVRERTKGQILEIAMKQLENTGHDELALLSLSTSDYSDFEGLAIELMKYCSEKDVSMSLPSLRMDSFSFKVLNEIQKYKKSGLTLAIEAGTQRLRDAINKGINEDDIFNAINKAIDLGWRSIKLYFMVGLPTETYEDLDGIIDITKRIIDLKKSKNNGKLGKFNVTVSVSNFVPKPDTPFQWIKQNSEKELEEKHNYLAKGLHIKGVTFNYHDNITSQLETVFARGGRNLGKVIYTAWKKGCKFDSWTEHFKSEIWKDAFEANKMDYKKIAMKEFDHVEILPWDVIDCGITKEYLLNEEKKAYEELNTKDCRYGCIGCGINRRTKCEKGGMYE